MFSETEPLSAEVQTGARELLESIVNSGRMPRALLLTGPEGVGKAAVASWLVRRLWCESAPAPCEQCSVCRKVLTLNHPDLHRLSRHASTEDADHGGKEITVGAVRSLCEALARAPTEASGRVALIVGADDLNEEAQNALLKLLEEPPGQSQVVLVAHRESALLPTVRSRCQDISLPPLSDVEMAAACVGLDPLAVRLASGRPGRAAQLDKLELEALLATLDVAAGGGVPAAQLAAALEEQVARLGAEVDEREALTLVLDVVVSRLTDLAWSAAGRDVASRLGTLPERLPSAFALRAQAQAVGEAQADLARNLPSKVALLALGREFARVGLGGEGPPTH